MVLSAPNATLDVTVGVARKSEQLAELSHWDLVKMRPDLVSSRILFGVTTPARRSSDMSPYVFLLLYWPPPLRLRVTPLASPRRRPIFMCRALRVANMPRNRSLTICGDVRIRSGR